jgi:ssDNA-binding Zn-finger/Zn-ribbon topoisomerase 1
MPRCEKQQAIFQGSGGQAVLGCANEVVGDYILPGNFSGNIGFGLNPTVSHKGKIIGEVTSYKVQDAHLVFLIVLNKDYKLRGTFWCDFKLNKLFSEEKAGKVLLDQIILDQIFINEPLYIQS